jgi:hypothetical protein
LSKDSSPLIFCGLAIGGMTFAPHCESLLGEMGLHEIFARLSWKKDSFELSLSRR